MDAQVSVTGGIEGRSPAEDVRLLAAIMLLGLFVLTPLVHLTTGAPPLVLVSIIGVGFGVATLMLRRLVLSAYVGTIVTSTLAANFPLRDSATFFPGSLGPQLFLFQIPLLVLLGVFLNKGWYRRAELTVPQYLLAGFVIWILISALAGPAPRPDVAAYFALLMAEAWLLFSMVLKAVETDLLETRTIVLLFAATVLSHVGLGLIQFVNRGPIGLSQLGEGSLVVTEEIVLPVLGAFPIGGHVSGYAASFALAMLAAVLAPIALTLAAQATGWQRYGWIVAFVLAALTVRLTGSDASRGAVLLGIVAVVIGLVIRQLRREAPASLVSRERARGLSWVALPPGLLVGTLFLLLPTTGSGKGSKLSGSPGSNSLEPSSSGGSGGEFPGGSEGLSIGPPNGSDGIDVQGLSVPFFDLSNLGIRFQQYVLSIELFSQYPVFGIGADNFSHVANSALPWLPETRNHRIHNIFLQLLAETGLPGFVLYMGSVGFVGLASVRLAFSEREGLLFLGVAAGLVAYFGLAFWGAVLDVTMYQLPFWTLCGVLAGEWYRRSGVP